MSIVWRGREAEEIKLFWGELETVDGGRSAGAGLWGVPYAVLKNVDFSLQVKGDFMGLYTGNGTILVVLL